VCSLGERLQPKVGEQWSSEEPSSPSLPTAAERP
jgi:hypothetical protein